MHLAHRRVVAGLRRRKARAIHAVVDGCVHLCLIVCLCDVSYVSRAWRVTQ
jgi:hypothetical protein